jgi:hypothetical protein
MQPDIDGGVGYHHQYPYLAGNDSSLQHGRQVTSFSQTHQAALYGPSAAYGQYQSAFRFRFSPSYGIVTHPSTTPAVGSGGGCATYDNMAAAPATANDISPSGGSSSELYGAMLPNEVIDQHRSGNYYNFRQQTGS